MYGYPYNQMTNYGNYGLNPQIPSPTRSEIIRVHGEEGAKAYQLPPNSAVLLLDDTNPILWFKSTDGAGYPQVTAYDISPLRCRIRSMRCRCRMLWPVWCAIRWLPRTIPEQIRSAIVDAV